MTPCEGETTSWRIRHKPGVWLGAEPKSGFGLVGGAFTLFVGSVLSFFLTGLLQLMLPLKLSWLISGAVMLSAWLTLLRYRKRNVVHFEPLVLREHRKRPWGWRSSVVPIPTDGLRVVAKGEVGLTGVMTFTVSLVSDHTPWELFREHTHHRHFLREVASVLAETLKCPFEDALDHPDIQRLAAPEAEGVRRDKVMFGEPSQIPRRLLMGFAGFALLGIWGGVFPDEGLPFALLMSIVPVIFFYLGWLGRNPGETGVDLVARKVVSGLGRGDERAPTLFCFDSPDAHIVVTHSRTDGSSNETTYHAVLSSRAAVHRLPRPPEVGPTAEELFPWVRAFASEAQLPIELIGQQTMRRWGHLSDERVTG
ncbi:MAG: hypothetical protein ACPGU1_19080 [Myxococcota bacterium]